MGDSVNQNCVPDGKGLELSDPKPERIGNWEDFVGQMEKETKEIDIKLTSEQMSQFFEYYKLLLHWNSMINLTAITEMREVVTKHFVDSLSIIKAVPDIGEKKYKVIDVGTGAGFPGIPLKIAFPDLHVTLLDSLNKRIRFLDEVIETLGLSQIETRHGRAEDAARDNVSRETFDLCVSRAVANLSTLSEYCLPFVRTGGYFVSYKSGKIEEELKSGKNAAKKLGGELEEIVTFQLPNSDERDLVKIRKISTTPKKYPRKAGTPSREPLK